MLLCDADLVLGPFGVDLIEPHIKVFFDMIDFDVSNLYVEFGVVGALGLRCDTSRHYPLDTIVSNIAARQCHQLRPSDDITNERADKLRRRGWNVIIADDAALQMFLPSLPLTANRVVYVELHEGTALFQHYQTYT